MFKTYKSTMVIEAVLLTRDNVFAVAEEYNGSLDFDDGEVELVVGGVAFYLGDLVYEAPNGELCSTSSDGWEEA